MPDKCPLDTGLCWEGEGQIPDLCRATCGPLWEEAARGIARLDIFDEGCMAACDIEFGDEALQRVDPEGGSARQYSILNMCANHGTEMYAEEWEFECPYN